MISRSARRRIRQERMGATRMRERANRAKARHLVKTARGIEYSRAVGKPMREKGRFVGVKAIYARIGRLLRSEPRSSNSLAPTTA